MKEIPINPFGSHTHSLLQSKLSPPIGGRSLVLRPRLDNWLISKESARLVLVNAPAGFGKTTLLTTWFNQLQHEGHASAWLTVDDADNDPGRFINYLVAAINRSIPDVSVEPTLGDIDANQDVKSGAIIWLLEKLASYPDSFFLFLDDFGVIKNPEVLSIVQQLILHLPPDKRVVMALRHTSELGLGRIRAQGRLAEITAEDLRFSVEETEEFVRNNQSDDLNEDDVKNLYNFTEGWVTGIQLSTLSPAWRNNFGSSMRTAISGFGNISEYLAEDVLARQPEEIQAFLMQTSILNRLSGPICNLLTGRTDGYEMLEYLERANLFLIPQDEERRWYRYHSLFARFLRNRLERRGRDHFIILHRIASNWCEKEGAFQEAAQHALACGDIEYAAGLMERCALGIVIDGQMLTVVEWAEQLPRETLDIHPSLQMSYCYALIVRRSYEKAYQLLEHINQGELFSANEVTLKTELLPLLGLLLAGQDKISMLDSVIANGLSKYVEAKQADHPMLVINTSLMHLAGTIEMTKGNFDEALAYFGRAAALMQRLEKHQIGTLYNNSFIAHLDLTQGRTHEALETVTTALAKCIGPARYSAGGMAAATVQAAILYEFNELEKAERIISSFRSLLGTSILPDNMIIGLRILARIKSARGDVNGAQHSLTELERLGAERNLPRAVASAHLEEVRLALHQGDVKQALQIARDHDDKTVWKDFGGRCMMANDPETPEICTLRLLIAKGHAVEALEKFDHALLQAQSAKRVRQQILILILKAKAYEAGGERRPALRALRDALLISQTGGFIRMYLDEGEPIPRLLKELYRTAPTGDSNSIKNISSDYFKQLLHPLGEVPLVQATQQPEQNSTIVEELTDREIAILESLATGLSNEDIADQLYISKHTVRFHLRNINSKLGASTRTQAVAIARQSGIIR